MMDNKHTEDVSKNYLNMVQKLVSGMQYGSISIIIQDGKVVQIEKNEKYRMKN